MKSHHATISSGEPGEVRPEGPPGVGAEVPQTGADQAGGGAHARSAAPDRGGERPADQRAGREPVKDDGRFQIAPS